MGIERACCLGAAGGCDKKSSLTKDIFIYAGIVKGKTQYCPDVSSSQVDLSIQ